MAKKKIGHLKNVSLKKYCKFLDELGCKCNRTKGGHMHYSRKDLTRPLTLQTHKDPVPEFIIRNQLRLLNITKETALSILSEI